MRKELANNRGEGCGCGCRTHYARDVVGLCPPLAAKKKKSGPRVSPVSPVARVCGLAGC